MSGTKDYASPALSLSLAGVFRNAARAEEEVEEGDEESGGGGCRGETVDISSENTGTGRSEQDGDDEEPPEGDGEVSKGKNKKRKTYHRHTSVQIREMEALFKESPHPDEQQRQQLSKKLGLAPRQVKFWFQNRRTQIKAMQERHENSLLKSEMDKLRDENRSMREIFNKACCPNCGSLTSYKDATQTTEVQQLRLENARLKAEVEKLRAGKVPEGAAASGSSCSSPSKEQDNRSSLDYYSGFFGVDKPKILEIVDQAMDELMKMATTRDPLWVRSLESGREILNYDEYVREFSPRSSDKRRGNRRSIEASRETGVVILDISRMVQSFIDVNQWKDMFPCMISKAATVDVISEGEEGNRNNGVVQLMFAELQMVTPMVPTREVYFIRHCKQHSPDVWAVVDVSIDAVEDNIDASLVKCRKLPSGCIIEDKANGHCKVTWVEHVECQRGAVHTMYRPIVSSGLAFGAWHWMATLQQQCERLVFFMATNVPTKDSSGVPTLAGRKSTLRLAQRMTSSFCHAVGASSYHTWTKMSTKDGDDMRISSRKNLNDPGEPVGIILCAVASVWLPVSAAALFDFLRDDTRRSEWDMLLTGGTPHTIANIAKGQDRGNSVTLHAVQSRDSRDVWFLQDSCTNAYESTVVYAPVDIAGMKSVMGGCDSGGVEILPSGFSILPDIGLGVSAVVITTRPEEKSADGGGSLLTVALQVVANTSPAAKLTMESVDALNALVSSTLQSIKKYMQCDEG